MHFVVRKDAKRRRERDNLAAGSDDYDYCDDFEAGLRPVLALCCCCCDRLLVLN